MLAAAQLGIVNGMGDGSFAPGGAYTRGQATCTAMRLYELVK